MGIVFTGYFVLVIFGTLHLYAIQPAVTNIVQGF